MSELGVEDLPDGSDYTKLFAFADAHINEEAVKRTLTSALIAALSVIAQKAASLEADGGLDGIVEQMREKKAKLMEVAPSEAAKAMLDKAAVDMEKEMVAAIEASLKMSEKYGNLISAELDRRIPVPEKTDEREAQDSPAVPAGE